VFVFNGLMVIYRGQVEENFRNLYEFEIKNYLCIRGGAFLRNGSISTAD
jgi:hypothetical protein